MSTENRGAFGFGSLLTIASVLSLVALTSTGCGLLKKKGDDAPDAAVAVADEAGTATDEAGAAPAAEAGAAPVAAVNVADVARFPDEVPVANVPATIARPTNVRDTPAVGKISAALAKGGTVTEIATHGTALLITFANPANQQQLMGWVGPEAFTAITADAGLKQPTCVAGDTAVRVDIDICVRVCTRDSDCSAGTACQGTSPPAQKLVNGVPTGITNVCKPVVPTTAAVATAAAIRLADVAVSQGGRCPVGATISPKDLQCHRNCSNVGGGVAACDPGFRCLKCPALPASVCVANGSAAAFCK